MKISHSIRKFLISFFINIEIMIVTTTDTVPGKEIKEVLGICRGSTVRARNFGRDILAGFKNMVGGEIEGYTKLQAESR